MKKLNLFGTLALVAALAFTSCQKNDTVSCLNDPVENPNEQSIETPEAFAERIPNAFDAMEIMGGTENAEMMMENESVPLFLDLEPFGVEDEAMDGKGDRPCALRDSLALRDEQKVKLRGAWADYLKCREGSMHKLRANYRELRSKYEKHRKEALAALRNQRITEREFKAKMEKLRLAFHAELMKLNRTYHDVIKHCYKEYLMKARHILTEAQFRVFIHCFRGHLPYRK